MEATLEAAEFFLNKLLKIAKDATDPAVRQARRPGCAVCLKQATSGASRTPRLRLQHQGGHQGARRVLQGLPQDRHQLERQGKLMLVRPRLPWQRNE